MTRLAPKILAALKRGNVLVVGHYVSTLKGIFEACRSSGRSSCSPAVNPDSFFVSADSGQLCFCLDSHRDKPRSWARAIFYIAERPRPQLRAPEFTHAQREEEAETMRRVLTGIALSSPNLFQEILSDFEDVYLTSSQRRARAIEEYNEAWGRRHAAVADDRRALWRCCREDGAIWYVDPEAEEPSREWSPCDYIDPDSEDSPREGCAAARLGAGGNAATGAGPLFLA